MNEIKVLVDSMREQLQEMAKHSSKLGNGLLNAAPGDKSETSNPSVTYLLTMADHLNKAAQELDKFAK